MKEIKQLNELEIFVICLARGWFSGEKYRLQVARDLNIKFGYFKGYKVSRSINELLSFIYYHQPTISINTSGSMQVIDDELRIVQLIFPDLNSNQTLLRTAKRFVPKAKTKNLVRLAKMVNLSLT